jgi:3-phenylpropionate/trans-cinnamate dioxygenase ferredoxin reductase subunit
MQRFVIIGAGLAGAMAAVTLRREGFDGSLVLIGAERRPPYERPPLSKSYLRGETPFEDTLVRPADFYGEHGIELRSGTEAKHVDVDRRVVGLADGDDQPYDRLLLATGARNRRPAIPGDDLADVLSLRTVEDCDRLRDAARTASSVVIGGLGFIGAEVAASLRQLELEVTAVADDPPLRRVLGPQVSDALADVHRDRGVRLVLGDRVASFEGNGRVEMVVTTGGLRIACDLAVIAAGVEPVTDLVDRTAIEREDGIVVDERCRTSIDGVFACGDVANHFRPLFDRRLRVEHWDNARRHGRSAALNMLGKTSPHDGVPWFWSEQYDDLLEYAGHHSTPDATVVRGRPQDRRFSVFFLEAGVVRAAASLNRSRDVRAATPLIAARRQVNPDQLRDEEVDLATLARGRA